jgi:HSP20 family protein
MPPEIAEFTEEVRQVFEELGRALGSRLMTQHYSPPLDIYERDHAVEIVMDAPGVDPAAVRVVIKRDAVLIVGEKPERRPRPGSSFHLIERSFGRFARAVRVAGPCDMARATARLVDGELRVTLPKIAERRGRLIEITVQGRAS